MVHIEAKVLDPTHLELARPIAAPQGGVVLVSVSGIEEDDERQEWSALSARSLESAYGESEPEYSASSIREPNPEFAG